MASLDFELNQIFNENDNLIELEYVIPVHPNLKKFGHYNWWINDDMQDDLQDIFMPSDTLFSWWKFDLSFGDISFKKNYYTNGNVKSSYIYSELYDSEYEASYFENGNLKYLLNLEEYEASYFENGNLEHLTNFAFPFHEKIFDLTGKLIYEAYGEEYSEDWIKDYRYYESGQLSEVTLEGNRLEEEIYGDGVYLINKNYYESGQLSEVTIESENYIAEKIYGDGVFFLEKKYYESGELKSEIPYNDGALILEGSMYTIVQPEFQGLQKFYYENGQLSSKSNYKNGELEGEAKCWDESGNEISCD